MNSIYIYQRLIGKGFPPKFLQDSVYYQIKEFPITTKPKYTRVDIVILCQRNEYCSEKYVHVLLLGNKVIGYYFLHLLYLVFILRKEDYVFRVRCFLFVSI